MSYLPTRYLVSLYFVMGLVISVVLYEMFLLGMKQKKISSLKYFSLLILFIFGINNSLNYNYSFKNRSFKIQEINNYLAQYELRDKLILGAWAPSLAWDTKAITFPLWNFYFNDKNIVTEYKPTIIITEIGENDSEQVF